MTSTEPVRLSARFRACVMAPAALLEEEDRRKQAAALKRYNQTHKTALIIRHAKYLKNIVEQDHRAVKRLTRPVLGFKLFWAACCTIAGMEVMHVIRKAQLATPENARHTPAEQFYTLAA